MLPLGETAHIVESVIPAGRAHHHAGAVRQASSQIVDNGFRAS